MTTCRRLLPQKENPSKKLITKRPSKKSETITGVISLVAHTSYASNPLMTSGDLSLFNENFMFRMVQQDQSHLISKEARKTDGYGTAKKIIEH